MTPARFGEDFGQSRLAEGRFDGREGIVHPLVERTKPDPVRFQPEWALANPLDRFDRVHHIEDRQLGRRLSSASSRRG